MSVWGGGVEDKGFRACEGGLNGSEQDDVGGVQKGFSLYDPAM